MGGLPQSVTAGLSCAGAGISFLATAAFLDPRSRRAERGAQKACFSLRLQQSTARLNPQPLRLSCNLCPPPRSGAAQPQSCKPICHLENLQKLAGKPSQGCSLTQCHHQRCLPHAARRSNRAALPPSCMLQNDMLRHSAAPTAPPAQPAVQYVYYTAAAGASPAPPQYYIAAPPGQPPVNTAPAQQPQYYVVQQAKQDSVLKKCWKAMKPKSSDRWFVKVLKCAGIVLAGAVVLYVAVIGIMLICFCLGAAADDRKYRKPPSWEDDLYGRA